MKMTGQGGGELKRNRNRQSKKRIFLFEKPLNVPSHTKHAWNSCNYREHASLASLFCAIRAHH